VESWVKKNSQVPLQNVKASSTVMVATKAGGMTTDPLWTNLVVFYNHKEHELKRPADKAFAFFVTSQDISSKP